MNTQRDQNDDEQCEEADLADLFSTHRDRLWRLVCFRLDSRLRGRLDVDDILQESFLAAKARSAHMPDASQSTYVWLRLITLQTMTDLHRRHIGAECRDVTREQANFRRASSESTRSLLGAIVGDETSPSGKVRQAELSSQMQEAMSKLSESDAEVLMLRHFEELSNSEVAEVLQISIKAASVRYIRALSRFRDVLRTHPDFSASSIR